MLQCSTWTLSVLVSIFIPLSVCTMRILLPLEHFVPTRHWMLADGWGRPQRHPAVQDQTSSCGCSSYVRNTEYNINIQLMALKLTQKCGQASHLHLKQAHAGIRVLRASAMPCCKFISIIPVQFFQCFLCSRLLFVYSKCIKSVKHSGLGLNKTCNVNNIFSSVIKVT